MLVIALAWRRSSGTVTAVTVVSAPPVSVRWPVVNSGILAWVTLLSGCRRRELAQNKAEPGKNWNSFETFIFITLRVSSYKINQDPGREKSGRHFFRPFSRWPPLKIAKIKNKHNFDIIEPRKVILVSNSMFLSMIYSLVHLKMHFEVTWPEIQYGRHLNPLDMHWLKNTWWFLYSKCCPFGNIL